MPHPLVAFREAREHQLRETGAIIQTARSLAKLLPAEMQLLSGFRPQVAVRATPAKMVSVCSLVYRNNQPKLKIMSKHGLVLGPQSLDLRRDPPNKSVASGRRSGAAGPWIFWAMPWSAEPKLPKCLFGLFLEVARDARHQHHNPKGAL